MLKGVIVTCTGVFVTRGQVDQKMVRAVIRLLKFVENKGLKPVVLSNTVWHSRASDGTKTPLRKIFQSKIPTLDWYSCNEDAAVPAKPTKQSTVFVREQYDWAENEVVYIGNSQADMRTAVNGSLLFLNATWYGSKTGYGFNFDSPKDLAKFIDVFCLREHWWEFEIHEKQLDFYALSTFSTLKEKYAFTSQDARAAAKHGRGHPEFWARYLVSSLYFSGLYKSLHFITPYPGHVAGFGNVAVDAAVSTFANCFRHLKYLPDLIVRHTTATKSQTARQQGKTVDHLNQLNTIRLNETPIKSTTSGSRYVRSPLYASRTVVVVDDFCTNGYSLEAANAYIRATGADVIGLAWLKTINTDYEQSQPLTVKRPYQDNTFQQCKTASRHPYHKHLVNPEAQVELQAKLMAYSDWRWP